MTKFPVLAAFIRSVIAAVMLTVAPSATAQAPAQTIGSAMRFLSIQFDRGMTLRTTFPQGKVFEDTVLRSSRSVKTCSSDFTLRQHRDGWVGNAGLYWPDVVDVRQRDAFVEVNTRVAKEIWKYAFDTGSPELAVRVAYAMEFLRQACDPAGTTGF